MVSSSNYVKCPEPGIYPNVPFDTYLSWDALNHSTLKLMTGAPAKYNYRRRYPAEDRSPAKLFGSMSHAFLLEPGRFAESVVPAPVNPKTGRAYGSDTKAWADVEAANPGKIVASDEQIDKLRLIAESLRGMDGITAIFDHPGENEVCIVWDDKLTGERCKGRIDRLVRSVAGGPGIRLDLKTSEDAEMVAFSGSIVNYGYATQDEFYRRGCEALGLNVSSVLVVVETEAPYLPALYQIGEETAACARAIVSEWLARIARCKRDGKWPGYSENVEVIEAPEWWLKRWAVGSER